MPAPNQYNHSRNWKEEVARVCSKLSLCAVVPSQWRAGTRITTVCTHGVLNTTTVYRLINRQYCCKSQASRAHDPAMKSKAAKTRWRVNPVTHPQTAESNQKRSETLKETLKNLKEGGWLNPGWGYGPSEEARKVSGTLYLVRYLDDSGTHFKLGITKRSLQERLGDSLVSILHLHPATLGECFDLEQELLQWARENGHRYSSPTTTELIHPDGLPYLLGRFASLPNQG